MAYSVDNVDEKRIEIATPRLSMRKALDEDAAGLHEAFSDPEVMRYWSTPSHESITETEIWVQKMTQGPQNGRTDFVVCLKPDMTPIGKCGIWQDKEIGFMLARRHWGKGMASEALGAVMAYCFDVLEMPEIVADVDPRNKASLKVLQKLGFVMYDFKEKTLQIGEEWVDSIYLKATKPHGNA